MPLNLDEKVLVLTERLKKNDVPDNLYKASVDNMPFFNRDWVEEDGKKLMVDF